MNGSLYLAVGLARQMQKSTPSQALEVRRKRSFSHSLAGAMRVRALGQAAGLLAAKHATNRLLAAKHATNRYLHLAWLRMNENQTEGACTSGTWPTVACIAGASQARERKEPIRHH